MKYLLKHKRDGKWHELPAYRAVRLAVVTAERMIASGSTEVTIKVVAEKPCE